MHENERRNLIEMSEWARNAVPTTTVYATRPTMNEEREEKGDAHIIPSYIVYIHIRM